MAREAFGKAGHTGWTSMPVAFSPYWWQLVTTIVLGRDRRSCPAPAHRALHDGEKRARANRAVVVGGILIAMMTGVAFTVGALSNVYFVNTVGKIALLAGDKKTDNIMPSSSTARCRRGSSPSSS
jgi:SSS family solute:Na+ symporter